MASVVVVASGLTAVDVVLRERDAVAALSNAVRTIRRFADASILAKLRRAMRRLATAAELEQLLRQHNEDERLDALETCHERVGEPKARAVTPEQAVLVNHVLVYGAKKGSAMVVEYALDAAPSVLVNGALRAAINNGHVALVQRLYPKVRAFGLGFTEDLLLDLAAARGHTEMLDWMYAHRRDPRASCTWAASESAAKGGHVDVLRWIRLHCPEQWSFHVLEQAALHDQQCVLDWIYDERIRSPVSAVMASVARHNKFAALAWLHDKYPRDQLLLWTLKRMAATAQLDVVSRIVAAFPDRYADHGVVIGVLCGDLGLVQTLARRQRRHAKKELKYAMCMAARFGALGILQWLRAFAGCSVPSKALWQATRCGHSDVVAWIVEQTPALRTRAQLVAMRSVSAKQPAQGRSGDDRRGDSERLVAWIDAQLQQLTG